MTKKTRILVLAVALGLGLPIGASAQQPPHHGGGKAAPAARAAAPRMAAPHATPAPRMAAPQRMATPHAAPAPRMATPRFAPQRTAGPHHPPAVTNRNSPAVTNRAALQRQRQEFRQQRALHQQAQPAAQARTNLQSQPQNQQNTRQQLRAERNLRRAEDRQLRRVPASQRAQRREEIQNARQQRAVGRQQLVQPNALQAQPNARALRENRRNGTARLTPDAARQGRFASRFAQQTGGVTGRNRFWNVAAHNAWRHGHRARFVAWFGPVFWPYAYSDIFDYTFWPYGYDDGYWAYAYDDFFDGIFWGEAGPPEEYAYAGPSPRPSYGSASAPRPNYAAVRDLCRQPGSGVTAWPFAEIERKVGLNAEQKDLLGEIRKASQDAAAVFKASCPPDDAFPLTPPGRLDAMTARLEATLQTVQTVRPALENFYASLSDEQKERFNELGPKPTAANAEARDASEATDSCNQPKPGLANLPIEKIEDAINPTDAQEAELNKLQDATSKAVEIMQAACPNDTPLTPPGRLDAMEKRLQSMIDAAKIVKPALDSFYSSLSGEQKARFNRVGQQLSQSNAN